MPDDTTIDLAALARTAGALLEQGLADEVIAALLAPGQDGLDDDLLPPDLCLPACRLVTTYRVVAVVERICDDVAARPVASERLPDVARGLGRLAADRRGLGALLDAVEREDARAVHRLLDRFDLPDFCRLVVTYVLIARAELVCDLCQGEQAARGSLIDEVAEAFDTLAEAAGQPELLAELADAHAEHDEDAYRRILDLLGLRPRCHVVCLFLCIWHCVPLPWILCPQLPIEIPDREELPDLFERLAALQRRPELIDRLERAVEQRDPTAYESLVAELGLERWCGYLAHLICHLHCWGWCVEVCPDPDPLPWFTHIGTYHHPTQIDSGSGGDGRTTADDRAFYGNMRLNGTMYQTVGGQPIEYRFEYRDGSGVWHPVVGAQIARTVIGTWSRWVGGPDPVDSRTYTVNGSNTATERTVLAAADGWVAVPQDDDFWSPSGKFTSNGNQISLRSDTLMPWPDIDVGAVSPGFSTAPALLGTNAVFGLRMRVRTVGDAGPGLVAGTCENVAIYNRRYDQVNKYGSWATVKVDDQLAVAMIDIDEILGGCGSVTDTLTVRYTAAHPDLGAIELTMVGPGGPYGFAWHPDAAASPVNRYGYANPSVPVASLADCAYTVRFSAEVLLTTGDSVPDPVVDLVSFCKG